MSFVPSNVYSALIYKHSKPDYFHDLRFLFEVAFSFAKKGFATSIFTALSGEEDTVAEKHLLYPEILQRINFRYFKSSRDIIRWCHEAHYLQKKPTVILISMDPFNKPDEFNAYCVSAALIDALKYFSSTDSTKKFYLLALTSIDCVSHLYGLTTFFHYHWLYTLTEFSACLKPPNNEDHCSIQISPEEIMDFSIVEKIFHGYPLQLW